MGVLATFGSTFWTHTKDKHYDASQHGTEGQVVYDLEGTEITYT